MKSQSERNMFKGNLVKSIKSSFMMILPPSLAPTIMRCINIATLTPPLSLVGNNHTAHIYNANFQAIIRWWAIPINNLIIDMIWCKEGHNRNKNLQNDFILWSCWIYSIKSRLNRTSLQIKSIIAIRNLKELTPSIKLSILIIQAKAIASVTLTEKEVIRAVLQIWIIARTLTIIIRILTTIEAKIPIFWTPFWCE